MGWIQNISKRRVAEGDHQNPGKNSMLIQIADPAGEFPMPKYKFQVIHRFEFLDLEEEYDYYEEAKITDEQAGELVRVLRHAIHNDMNVIVHCNLGVCRSGAVCEVGVMMGLKDRYTHRIPNMLVKSKMMKVLGWTYE